LQELARWPLITYERDYMAYADIMGAFRQAHLEPRVALSTGDTDTMKTYALCGLGVAILGDHAYEPTLDTGLAEVPGSRTLFPSTPLYVGVRRDRPLSVQARRFVELVAPKVRLDAPHFDRNPA